MGEVIGRTSHGRVGQAITCWHHCCHRRGDVGQSRLPEYLRRAAKFFLTFSTHNQSVRLKWESSKVSYCSSGILEAAVGPWPTGEHAGCCVWVGMLQGFMGRAYLGVCQPRTEGLELRVLRPRIRRAPRVVAACDTNEPTDPTSRPQSDTKKPGQWPTSVSLRRRS
ncbi:hypothetical protein VTI74DRAFT_11456 [Chaetomium olivicolor]